MKISINDFNNMSTSDLFNIVLSQARKCYRFFRVLGIGEKDYDNLVISQIERTKGLYNGEEDYIEYITSSLLTCISWIIQEKKKDPKEYILKVFGSPKNTIREGQSLFFLKVFHEITYSLFDDEEIKKIMDELLSTNNIFSTSVTKIFTKYKNYIYGENIPDNINYPYIIDYVNYYCKYCNIDIEALKDKGEKDLDITKLFFQQTRKLRRLTPEEEKECFEQAREGSIEARNKIVLSYLDLVKSIARRYASYNISYLDLIQTGTIALMESIYSFDPNRECLFKTYATSYITGKIKTAFAKYGRNVRIPYYIIDYISKINKVVNDFSQKHKRFPTRSEIAEELGISLQRLDRIINMLKRNDSIEEKIELGKDISDICDYDDPTLTPVEAVVFKKMMSNNVNEVISEFHGRDIRIVKDYFKIKNGKKNSLETIGKKYKITRERVRQIINSTLSQINKDKRVKVTDRLDVPFKIERKPDKVRIFLFTMGRPNKIKGYASTSEEPSKPIIEDENSQTINVDISFEEITERVKPIFKDPIIRTIIKEDLFEDEVNIATVLLNNFERKKPRTLRYLLKSHHITRIDALSTILSCLDFYIERNYGVTLEEIEKPKTLRKKTDEVLRVLNVIQSYQEKAS